jgi:uncharacterized protein involved in outer membrane biogenesis
MLFIPLIRGFPMERWKKTTLWVVAILVLLMAFVAFVLPGIVKEQAIKGIESATGRKAAIARIVLNPLNWSARVEGFRLMEKRENVVFASFSSVRVSISPFSMLRMAPIVSRAQIASPYARIVRTAANTYNFSDLMKGKKSDKPLRFSINNITIDNGSIDFIDRALPAEKSHTLRRISVGIPFISSIKYYADRYVQPRFSAVVNGSPLKLEGKLRPYLEGAETSFSVNLQALSLPYSLSYYPGEPPVKMDSGRLSTRLDIIHRVASGRNPELELKGNVILEEIVMRDRSGEPLLSLGRGEARISRAEVMAGEFNISSLSADALQMNLSRDKAGSWNFQRLTGGEKAAAEKKPARKPLININETVLSNSRLRFSDSQPPGGFTTDIGKITFAMRGFSTARGKRGSYTLSFASAREEKGEVKGDFSVDPLSLETTAEIREILLDAYYPYLAETLTAPVKGRVDVSAGVSLSPDKGLLLTTLDVEARQVTLPFGKEAGVKLAKAVLSGGKASLKERTLEVGGVEIHDGSIKISRDAKGALSPLALLRETKKTTRGVKEQKETVSPFKFNIKNVSGADLNIRFTDHMKEDDPSFNLKKLSFSLADISGPRFLPIPFKVAASYGKKGSISASGNVNPDPLRLKGECSLKRIPLTDANPYLPDDLNITLADGLLDTKLAFNLVRTKDILTGNFRGSVGVRSFNSLDADDEELLKWESLQLDNMKGSLAPFSLDIAGVSLSRFYSRIVVNKNGTLNLQEIRRPAQKEEPSKEVVAAPPPPPPSQPPTTAAVPAPSEKKGIIRIGTVTMQDGTIAFMDHHTKPEYSSTMVNLGGRVSGLSSQANTMADVDLRGNLENHSPLRITGRINPLRDDLFVDLKVSFTDIELSPLTPYSGTFLGYSVDKGKLFLDLKYHIENKNLDSSNTVFIDQLTFGNKIESDKATSLPVRLAVALLKDRKGEIHLDLPVTGRIDDPQFSVWGVVFKILKNLLVKAATAPFTLLSSIFGGKEDFSNVPFAYGSSRLSEAEQGKLSKLCQAFIDRPALKLEVSGFVDRERDPEGYRNELLLKKMKNEKFIALVKAKKAQEGQGADSVEILPQEYSTYLKSVYKKEKFPKPRNLIGLQKDLPDNEMKKLFLTHTVVSNDDLQNLARERSVAVRNYLVNEGKLPPERVFEKKEDIFKAPAKEGDSGARVEFGVATQ